MEQRFVGSVFGGFKKREVLKYINDLIEKHHREILNLQKEHEKYKEESANKIKNLGVICENYRQELVKLQGESSGGVENFEVALKEKEEDLKLKDKKILELESRILELEEKLKSFKEKSNRILENKAKIAEFVVRERVNNIIKRGKVNFSNKYDEHIKKLKLERENFKVFAMQEATNIVKKAASRAYKINSDCKQSVKSVFDLVHKNAKKIISAAMLISKKILSQNFEMFLNNENLLNFEEEDSNGLCHWKDLQKEVDADVLKAMETLKKVEVFGDDEILNFKDFLNGSFEGK